MPNGVEFDIDITSRSQYKPAVSKLVQFVLAHSFGVVRDEEQANYVLLGTVSILIIFSVYFFVTSTSSGRDVILSPAEKTELLKTMSPYNSPLPPKSSQ